MSDSTPHDDEPKAPQPGGFAILDIELLAIWPYLPEHHMRVLPMILSFMPNSFPSQSTLAHLIGQSRQTVNAMVKQMATAGLFRVEQRTRKETQADTSCQYHKTDWSAPAVQQQIIDWYKREYPDTPRAVRDRTPLTTKQEEKKQRKQKRSETRRGAALRGALHTTPVSTLELDTPCQPLDLTPPVNPKTSHRVSASGVDTNVQGNTQGTEQAKRTSYTGPVAGAAATQPVTPPASPTANHLGFAVVDEAEGGHVRTNSPAWTTGGWTPLAPPVVGTPIVTPTAAPATAFAGVGVARIPAAAGNEHTHAPAAPTAPAVKQPRGDKPTPTLDRIMVACSSLDEMREYVLTTWFSDGRRPNRDWRRHRVSPTDRGLSKWSLEDFAACFWMQACEYKAARGQMLTPPAWGRICQHLKTKRDCRTAEQLMHFIDTVTLGFDAVRERVGGGASMTLVLDESVLQHTLVDMAYGTLMHEPRETRSAA